MKISVNVLPAYPAVCTEHVVLVSRRGAERDARRDDRLSWRPRALPLPLEVDLGALFHEIP